ncbi:MAG: lytic transglycosylase domain-containing protein [Desulfobacterales bacterium]|nr:lytic transglycosylase domain-containing protein [Desulfobacterales bacterium]
MQFLVWRGLVLIFLLAVIAGPAAAAAYIYSFVDEAGVLHFTNAPVDARYRPTRYLASAPESNSRAGRNYDTLIRAAARRHQLDPELIRAVIRVESNFEKKAVSSKGARGLMQLMPGTAMEMGVGSVFDPADNIMGGSRYLRKLYDRFQGDLELTLAAYNAGPNRVEESGGVPRIPETVSYVRQVLRQYRNYRGAGSGVRLTGAGK